MASLLLGPMLRYVGKGTATVWVETDAPCEVRVLDASSRTFTVCGHHYALVEIEGLEPDSVTPYEVHLDDTSVWPETEGPLAAWPPSVIRAEHRRRPFRLTFGSCRVAYPQDDDTAGVDALAALAEKLRTAPGEEWPDGLLFVGDQVYADDNISPETKAFVDSRRPRQDAPDGEINDFEEYTRLYQESWSAVPIRWLLSTVPSAMIFDDHDVRDDWNTSAQWRDDIKRTPWWAERISSGLMAYWVYQHLGNLRPPELARSQIYRAVRDAPDGAVPLRAYAADADSAADRLEGDTPDPDGTGGGRWSFRRDLGTSRLLVLDSRAGRIVHGDKREMISEADWAWLEQQVDSDSLADVDHLLIATSVPFLLPPFVHHLEAWNESVAAGGWGARFSRAGESLRQGADLEHWAAFGSSFDRMIDLLATIGQAGDGDPGRAPATVTFLSGDVHFAYVARARLRHQQHAMSPSIYQVVCSPLRNPLPKWLRYGQRAASSRVAHRLGRGVARLAGVRTPKLEWRFVGQPAFGNVLATLDLAGREALTRIETAEPGSAAAAADGSPDDLNSPVRWWLRGLRGVKIREAPIWLRSISRRFRGLRSSADRVLSGVACSSNVDPALEPSPNWSATRSTTGPCSRPTPPRAWCSRSRA
jgi:phosphodiesterase/alkaline phosphatase D-like protein